VSDVEVFLQRRFRCPHCRRSWTSKKRATEHVAVCWHDPARQACKTCRHHHEGSHGSHWEPPEPEYCAVDAAQDDDEGNYVIATNCPVWEPYPWLVTAEADR
jgi:hypothetical protein